MSRSATAATHPAKLLSERRGALLRQLPEALSGQEQAVHRLRVAGRRLRVALSLVARKPAGRRVRRARRRLRRLVQAAGRGRDLDVIATLFDRYVDAALPAERALRQRLRAAQRRARVRTAAALVRADPGKLRRQLVAVERRAADAAAIVSRVDKRAAAESAAALEALTALGGRFDALALHRVRIGCRRLRYAAELRAALGAPVGEALSLLRTLQEHLGAIHDACVLADWLARQHAARDGALAPAARRLRARVVESARARHAELLRIEPRRLLRAVQHALSPAPRHGR